MKILSQVVILLLETVEIVALKDRVATGIVLLSKLLLVPVRGQIRTLLVCGGQLLTVVSILNKLSFRDEMFSLKKIRKRSFCSAQRTATKLFVEPSLDIL